MLQRPGTKAKTKDSDKAKDDGAVLNKYLRAMGSIRLLSSADEVEVARRIQEGGADCEIAKAALIKANLRLVVSIAKQYIY